MCVPMLVEGHGGGHRTDSQVRVVRTGGGHRGDGFVVRAVATVHYPQGRECEEHRQPPQARDTAGGRQRSLGHAGKGTGSADDRVVPPHRRTVGTGTGYSGVMVESSGPHGYSAEKQALLSRLKRVEGQVRGLQRMVDDDTYCIDVLTQISAATKALQAVAVGLLEDHLRHCVVQAAVDGNPDAKIKEATAAIARLVRS
jgi:DNA-binding FrmR family transcriptional regulator